MTKRIAMVLDPWNHPFNGTVVSTRRFVHALEQRGTQVNVLSLDDGSGEPGKCFSKFSAPGVNHVIDRMRTPLAWPDQKKLEASLEGCDLLHVQYPFFLGYAALKQARRMSIPVVCSFHIQPENILLNLGLSTRLAPALYRMFLRLFYNRADHVIAPSQFAADLLVSHGLKTPYRVVSNGIPPDFFDVPFKTSSSQPYRLLSVGRLAREKRQDLLIQAVGTSEMRDQIQLDLVGVGPTQSRLQRLAERFGVRANIGRVDDETLMRLYGEADLFVHTSQVELEGMSVLEAMASGNCVILSDSSDSASVSLMDGPEARFRSGDAGHLKAQIETWLASEATRDSQARRNREYARHHSLQASVAALADVYEQVLGKPLAWNSDSSSPAVVKSAG
jgi:glycosyltransferase involved in cell wall biosynthesis